MKKALLVSGLFALLTVIASCIAAVRAPQLTDFIGLLIWTCSLITGLWSSRVRGILFRQNSRSFF